MRVSICIAAYDKPRHLARALASIYRQYLPRDVEVIVVDDGSSDEGVHLACKLYPLLKYVRLDRSPVYRNPAVARNVAYRAAVGEIIVCQSDDVEHQGSALRTLVDELLAQDKTFVLARVVNRDWQGNPCLLYGRYHELVGPGWNRPLFFLGALYRRDLYAVGGNDERFTAPGREDVWFADCLMNGLGLTPYYSSRAVGYHLDHPRPIALGSLCIPSTVLYRRLHSRAMAGLLPWLAPDAPWPLNGASIT